MFLAAPLPIVDPFSFPIPQLIAWGSSFDAILPNNAKAIYKYYG